MPAIPFIVSSQYEIDNSSGAYGVVITPYGSNNVTRFQYTLNGMAPWTTTMDATIPIRIFPTFSPLYTVKVIAMNEYGSSGESNTITMTAPGQPVISLTYTESYPGYLSGLYSGIYTINVTTEQLNGSAITNYAYSMDGGSYQNVGATNPINIKVSSPTYPSPHTFAVKAITALGTSPASSISSAGPTSGPTIPVIDVTYTGGSYRINVVALPSGFIVDPYFPYYYSMDGEANIFTETMPVIIPFTLDGISHSFKVAVAGNLGFLKSNTSTAIIYNDRPVIVVTYALTANSSASGIYTINVIWVPDGFVATNYAYSMDGGSYITVSNTNPIIIPYLGDDEFHSFSLYAINAQGTTTPESDQSPAVKGSSYVSNGGGTYTPSADVPSTPKISVYYVKGSYKITVTASVNTNSPAITNYSYSMDGGSYITVSKTNPISVPFIGNNTSHRFTVKALNSRGWSAASSVSPAVRAPLSSTTGQTG